MKNIEKIILAHRYLYYVESMPVISDYEYDMLEASARKTLPEESKVHSPGSDRAIDYTDDVIALAEEIKIKHKKLK